MTEGRISSGGSVNRRTVLLSIAGVVVGSGLLGVDAATGRSRATARPAGPAEVAGVAEVAGPAAPASSAEPLAAAPVERTAVRRTLATRVPSWARRWNAPIYDLEDFLHRDGAVRYPKRSVLLTIDDGPSAEWTPRYLRLLEKHGVQATFNLIGEQVPANRHLVRATAAEGHVLSNHTWTHDERLPDRAPERIHREIARTNEAIQAATGHVPNQFRAPGGVWGPRVYAELARQQMMPLGWDIDPRDWARPGVGEIESAMLAARRGDIVLCHDGGGDRSQTYRALQTVIPELLQRGLHFVTLPTRSSQIR